nr:uncharacterized aarF domain-containing protein kinase 2 isoform X5 [Dasypus novemcinctus]
MVTPWRFSVRFCFSYLRRFELRKGFALLRPSRCCHNARLCWLLLGTLPKLISAHENIGEGSPKSLCSQRGGWCDLAENGSMETVSQDGLLGSLFLHLRICLRAGILFVKFFPLLLLYPFTYLAPSISSLWLHLLLKATETSGPTYIKLGQWASTRRDIFSEAFCVHFSKLHVQVTPHSWTHTEHFLQQAFGGDWGRVLCFESQEPVGSGCVAQVYKAYANAAFLGNESLQKIVKASSLQASLEAWKVSRSFGKEWKPDGSLADQLFLERLLFPKADLVGSNAVESQASSPAQQPEPNHRIPVAVKIDLRYEARNLEHFQDNFLNVNSVKFPTPLRPFVTRDVLVETYEESVPVSSYQQSGIPTDLKRKIAWLGIHTLLKMIFVDNFVHADLHPGNILVQGADCLSKSQEAQLQQEGACDTLVVSVMPALCPLRLVLLDAGIVAELQAADLKNFRAVFLAVMMGQGQKVAELFLHHARASECRNVEGFKAEMAALVTQARKNTVTLEKIQVSSLLSSVFKLLMTHKVKLESNFASIVFAVMVLEGLGRSLDPKLDILEAAKPFLFKKLASSS